MPNELADAASAPTEITKEQARAWLGTVLHPIARVVKIARTRGTNWSFRAHMRDFELVVPIASAVSPVFDLNVRHFRKHHPALSDLMREYDQRLEALRVACQVAYDWLVKHPKVLAIASDEGRAVAPFLAEYVINGVRELSHDYALRERWQRDGSALRELANTEGALQFAAIQNAGDAFRDAAIRLDEAIEALILDLADRYGLPPVDPDTLAG